MTAPTHYCSFTLADPGYAGHAFAYVVDFEEPSITPGGRNRLEHVCLPLVIR